MFSNGFLILLVLLSVSPIGWSQTTETAAVVEAIQPQSEDIFLLCRREKGVRWLRAYKLENGKCKTVYSKEGYLQVIGSATFFSSCEGVLQSVKKNIEEGGFKCVPLTQVSVLEIE